MTIRIMLADDHKMFRQGLCTMLNEHPDMDVVGEAEDGATVIKLARKLKPDLIVMDINMPGMNGIDAGIFDWDISAEYLTELIEQIARIVKPNGLSFGIASPYLEMLLAQGFELVHENENEYDITVFQKKSKRIFTLE